MPQVHRSTPVNPTAERIRVCLRLLASGKAAAPDELPRTFEKLARAALRRARGGQEVAQEEVEDLVSEFLFSLWQTGRKNGGMVALAHEWCAWPDARLVGTVKKTLFHAAVKASPHWAIVKGLRSLIKAALEKGLPPDAVRPDSLHEGNRLNAAAVAKACAYVVACKGPEAPEKQVAWLANELMAEYGLGEVAGAHAESADIDGASSVFGLEPCAHPGAQHEVAGTAVAVAEEFRVGAGEEGARTLTLRRHGFLALAQTLGCALGTAHSRFRAASKRFVQVAKQHGASEEECLLAVELLCARSG